MFKHADEREWFKTYWCIDIHGTISQPDYREKVKEIVYYPYAKETLQLLTKRKDIILIMYSSSFPDELAIYNETFEKDEIHFNYINENPEISTASGAFGYYAQKLYFNVLFDDKAGFDPETEWKNIYDYLRSSDYRPDESWSHKTKEKYHN
jgi:hypothetical protein